MNHSLDTIPMELIGEIASHLKVQDLREMSLVSKKLWSATARHLFYSVMFQGDREEVTGKLLSFLVRHPNEDRMQQIRRACRSVDIVVVDGANANYAEAPDYLPSIILSTIRKFDRLRFVGLCTEGLTVQERAKFMAQLKDVPRWTGLRTLRIDAPNSILKKLGQTCLRQVTLRGIDLLPLAREHHLSHISTQHRRLKELRLTYRAPLVDIIHRASGTPAVDVSQLSELETLIFSQADEHGIGSRTRALNRPPRLGEALDGITDALQGMDTLRRVSIYFNNRLMSWLPRQAWALLPGQPHRNALNNLIAGAIKDAGQKLPNLVEFCLVEVDEAGIVFLLHRGKRVHQGQEMETWREVPSQVNTFPIGIMY